MAHKLATGFNFSNDPSSAHVALSQEMRTDHGVPMPVDVLNNLVYERYNPATFSYVSGVGAITLKFVAATQIRLDTLIFERLILSAPADNWSFEIKGNTTDNYATATSVITGTKADFYKDDRECYLAHFEKDVSDNYFWLDIWGFSDDVRIGVLWMDANFYQFPFNPTNWREKYIDNVALTETSTGIRHKLRFYKKKGFNFSFPIVNEAFLTKIRLILEAGNYTSFWLFWTDEGAIRFYKLDFINPLELLNTVKKDFAIALETVESLL